MGYNTTVVVLNDALDSIANDVDFGCRLADAIRENGVRSDRPRDVSAGGFCNAAVVVETHHSSELVAVLVGHNEGRVLTAPVEPAGTCPSCPLRDGKHDAACPHMGELVVDARSEASFDEVCGLYRKYEVTRTDGSSGPRGKHERCDYFVLDIDHDPNAFPAVIAYASACQDRHPRLAADLRRRAVGEKTDQLSREAAVVIGKRCRRCSECRGENHHWIEHCDDPAEVAEPFVGFVCKHCDARAEMCVQCDGAAEPGHTCEVDEEGDDDQLAVFHATQASRDEATRSVLADGQRPREAVRPFRTHTFTAASEPKCVECGAMSGTSGRCVPRTDEASVDLKPVDAGGSVVLSLGPESPNAAPKEAFLDALRTGLDDHARNALEAVRDNTCFVSMSGTLSNLSDMDLIAFCEPSEEHRCGWRITAAGLHVLAPAAARSDFPTAAAALGWLEQHLALAQKAPHTEGYVRGLDTAVSLVRDFINAKGGQ